jgi:3-dehydroquinate synthase
VICITNTLTETVSDYLVRTNPDKIFLLCDAKTKKYCLPRISDIPFSHLLEMPAGESAKTLETCERIWNELTEHGATRRSVLFCLGGGSLTDLGGFVASVYQRGITVVYIPTTLLCMVDAGIGGKNGINLGGLKNYIGTFRMPDAIFIDPNFLLTLSDEEWTNGKAEVIKHALLSGNGWNDIEGKGFPKKDDIPSWTRIIEANTLFKQKITTADFAENNIRAMLNFGHTAAHALETLYLKKGKIIAHGRAVAAGMIIETMAAEALQICENGLSHTVKKIVLPLFERVDYTEKDIAELNIIAAKDKKSVSGSVVCSLISAIGKPCEPVSIPEPIMTKAWLQYMHDTL